MMPPLNRKKLKTVPVGTGVCQCGCGGKVPLAKKTDLYNGYITGKPRRFLSGHSTRRINLNTRIEKTADCWIWRGRRGHNGYGTWGARRAHRVVYERLVGPIPE